MASTAADPFQLGEWTVRPRENSIQRGADTRTLEPKLMEVLVFLAARPQRVHLRQEILDAVWRDTFVTDEVLTNAVWELRRALGDDAKRPRYIKTVPRKGYGLVAAVGTVDTTSVPPAYGADRAWRERLPTVAIVVAIGILVSTSLALRVARWQREKAPWPASITVLPIEALSREPSRKLFAVGLGDSLTTQLAATGRFEVPSRSSVMELSKKGLTASQIAQQLGAEAYLEGTLSFSKAGRVLLAVQLIDQRRNRHVWAGTFEDDIRENLAAQRRLARRVAVQLTEQRSSLPGEPSSDAAAATPTPPPHRSWQFHAGGEVWSSPRLTPGGQLLVGSDDDNLYALDPQTGTEVWRFTAPAEVRDVVAVSASRVFLATGTYLQALDAATGQEAWRRRLSIISPPTFVPLGNGLLVGGSYDRHLYGLDPRDGTLLWRVSTRGENRTAAAVVGSQLVAGTDAGELLVADLTSGKAQLRLDLDSPIAGVEAGPERDAFVATDGGFLYRLSLDGSEIWRRHLDSRLGAAPLFADGLLYLGTGSGRLLALDASDGRTLWTFEARDAITSKPRLEGDTLYIGSLDHDLYALDAVSGAERWRFASGGWVVTQPLVVAGRVVFSGLDAIVHAVPLAGPAEPKPEAAWPRPGHPQGRTVQGSLPELSWRHEVRQPVRLAVRQGQVFVGTGQGVLSLDAASGADLWQFATSAQVEAAPLVDRGRVVFGTAAGTLFAVAEETGAELWRQRLGAGTVSPPAAADGVVYLGDDAGRVHALSESTGEPLWVAQTGHFVNDSPLVLTDRVLVGSCDEQIWAFGRRDGQVLWKSHAGECVVSDGVRYGDLAIYGSYSGDVLALDTSSGDRRWTFSTGGKHIWYRPLLLDGTLYFGSGDYHLYALDAATGEERWRFRTGNRALSEIAHHGDTILFGSHDRHLYAIDRRSGKELWSLETTRAVEHLTVAGDVLFFIGDEAYVFAYRLP